MTEGSGSRAGSGSGSIPLTNGSGFGSRRPKNMWIRWIRIRNTAGRQCNFGSSALVSGSTTLLFIFFNVNVLALLKFDATIEEGKSVDSQ
jgi:hypothetical protein